MKRLNWDNYFLLIAGAVSKRSTCLRRQYGAVLVDKYNKIISTGYNGSSHGEENCIDVNYCIREKLGIEHGTQYELCKAVHAEMNAIINAEPSRLENSTIYIYGESDGTQVESSPCLLCKRVIANAHIKRVVYVNNKNQIISYLVNPSVDKIYYKATLWLFYSVTEDKYSCTLTTDTCTTSKEALKYFNNLCENNSKILYKIAEENLKDKESNKDNQLLMNINQVKEVTKEEYESTQSIVLFGK